MKIYTKTGDQGETSLFGGGRVRKNHARVEAFGAIDELNAALGVALSAGPAEPIDHWLREIQQHLFHLGSDLATPLDAKSKRIPRIGQSQVYWLEETIDRMTEQLEPLRNFILPGGTPVAAQLHVARTVCRRAERQIVALQAASETNALALVYINRLSDWLFTLARYENSRAGESEQKWTFQS